MNLRFYVFVSGVVQGRNEGVSKEVSPRFSCIILGVWVLPLSV